MTKPRITIQLTPICLAGMALVAALNGHGEMALWLGFFAFTAID